eukprot:436806-Amphidinium_carterae.3
MSSGLFSWTSKSHCIRRTGILGLTKTQGSGPRRRCPGPDWRRCVLQVQTDSSLQQEVTAELHVGKIHKGNVINIFIVHGVCDSWQRRTCGGGAGTTVRGVVAPGSPACSSR